MTEGKKPGKRVALRVLLALLAPYKGLVALTLLALVFDMGGMLFVPTELSVLVNAAISASDVSELVPHGLAMLVAALVGSGGAVMSSYFASRLAANVGRDMRTKVYESSLAFSGADFEGLGTGSMITRTLSDANVVQQTLLMSLVMIVPVPVMCVISIWLAFMVDGVMGWVLLAVAVVIASISIAAVSVSAPIFTRLQGFIDNMNSRLRESITGVRVIRAFGREPHEQKRLDQTFSDYASNAIRVNYMFSLMDCSTFFLMNIVESLILFLGANRVGVHAMQVGSITALIEYAMMIMFFMMMMQFALLSVPRAMACLARAGEVMGLSPSIKDVAQPTELAGHPDEVARFDHVSFRFADADEDTLHDLDFALRRGQVTAIIGNTGSGKSTIAKLLLRFHDVTDGSLTFGGCEVRELAQPALRSRIAYVPQKAWLFSGTIAQNLRHGDEHATDERLLHALKVSQSLFVDELPEGLDASVSQGGTNFSGGQRQRLAIARALVRKADLYVFDDSFSALDYKTDAALRHALKGELSDAAQLIIAQRVSTIHDADQIVVLSDGKVVGLGTHDELMETCQTYRAIADSQSRGEDAHE